MHCASMCPFLENTQCMYKWYLLMLHQYNLQNAFICISMHAGERRKRKKREIQFGIARS